MADTLVWTDAVIMLRDGDSGHALDPATGTIESLRILGYDTPEIAGHSECPEEYAHGIRAGAGAQRIVTTRRVEIEWRDRNDDGLIDRGRHGRGLGTVHLLDEGGARVSTLYAELVPIELALPYDGGTRPDWCRYLRVGRSSSD